jgi:hypothetical protein
MNAQPFLNYAPKVAQRLSQHAPYGMVWDRIPSILAETCRKIRSGKMQPTADKLRNWMEELQDIDNNLLPDVLRGREEWAAEQKRRDGVRRQILAEKGERCANNACWQDHPEASWEDLSSYKGKCYCRDCHDAQSEHDRMRSSESYWQENE